MEAAGTAVVGVPVDTDKKIICPPGRYADDRGTAMWNKVMGLLEMVERKKDAA
jgi:hypothetical protein